ncbi:hemolymph lipopolysaccharide-binding protein-like [Diprion similis]|uniref:hemolymph lipopolysaccharide-binding protein-like n=1 Tax=Diprion similis TaxID=362088 RepID=UPI001EF79DE9|nr:hemolymph lipopolysaccharide-binding protein-like [Diprion similis]
MALRFFAVQTLLCLVSYTLAQQSCFDSFVVMPARTASCQTPGVTPGPGTTDTADSTCLVRNPPVVKRNDYTYFPGIGGYKLHYQPLPWNRARRICEDEGGHLAIINSVAERDAVMKVMKAKNPQPLYVSLGFHDLYQEGQYVTIHGQDLDKTGFYEWASSEPTGTVAESCGSLHSSGGLNDHGCQIPFHFICELPIH